MYDTNVTFNTNCLIKQEKKRRSQYEEAFISVNCIDHGINAGSM